MDHADHGQEEVDPHLVEGETTDEEDLIDEEDVTSLLEARIQMLEDLTSNLVAHVHNEVDRLERMIASLMMGVTDLFAGTEAVLRQQVAKLSDQERQAFDSELLQRRNELYQGINSAVEDYEKKRGQAHPQP